MSRNNYDEALIRQITAQFRNSRKDFYQNATTEILSGFSDNITIPRTAMWEAVTHYGMKTSINVKVKAGDTYIGGQIHGKFKPSFVGFDKDNIPMTDYEDVAQRTEMMCDNLKRSMLDNIAEKHSRMLNALINIADKDL